MLANAAIGIINHVLGSEGWAAERLQAFGGKTVRFEQGAVDLRLTISGTGLFVAAEELAPADVVVTLPADAPIRILLDRPSLFTKARINGSAELAETLGFIFRNLSWDAEHDLSLLVGDIAARRLVAGSAFVLKWHRKQAKNLALNLAEYFTEENPAIARRRDVAAFATDVGALTAKLREVEKRVEFLEHIESAAAKIKGEEPT